jgi:hypothetical protein
MNAPQWFLERTDSVELINLLSASYDDPIVELDRLTGVTGSQYLIIYETPERAWIQTYYDLINIESDLVDKMKKEFVRLRCAYDTKNDQYMPISVCLVVGKKDGN